MNVQLRAIVGARVSVLKGDEKVSHIAQHETGGRWAQAHDATVVDTFEDLDVSATVSPFDRPDLGPWLTEEKAHEWDVIVWSKIDRAFRDPADSINVAKWCEQRQKIMVFADDGLMLDFRPEADMTARMMAEMFLLMGSMFAKWELRRFQSRAVDAHRVLRHMDRWAGGSTPEGFKTAAHPSGKGRTLAQDPVRQRMLHKCAELLVVDRQSINGVAKWLQKNGYLTTKDYQRPPDKRRGTRWSASQVIDMLTSLNTQGIKLMGQGKNRRPVLDEHGNMIQLAPPTFDDDMWTQIQAAVEQRRYGPKTRVNGASPMGGVVYCQCGTKGRHRVNHTPHGTYRYYNCGNPLDGCTGVSRRADAVEAIVEQTFLEECGDATVLRKVFVPGEDHTEQLERVKGIISALRDDRALGLIVGAEDEERFRNQMKALIAQRTELEALPQRSAGWRYEETDETYGDVWRAADTEGRRRLLVDAGVRIVLFGRNEWQVQIPEDLKKRLASV